MKKSSPKESNLPAMRNLQVSIPCIPRWWSKASTVGVAFFLSCLMGLGVGQSVANEPGQSQPDDSQPSNAEQWGDGRAPKNYVRSKGPKKSSSAYNWIQMAYGGGVILLMGGFIVFLIRRNIQNEDV